jgi:CPSF A subunit region
LLTHHSRCPTHQRLRALVFVTRRPCAQVTAVSRVRLLAASRVSFGVLVVARSGALAWVQPLTTEHHATLSALCAALHSGIPHAAGLNPKRYRTVAVDVGMGPDERGYGAPPPADGVLDGELLWTFTGLTRRAQDQVLKAAGVVAAQAFAALQEAALAASFF